MRKLEEHEVTFTLEVFPEDAIAPEDTFAYATDAENRAAVAHVRELAERSVWGWCRVIVRAMWGGFEGCDSLGGCSYESEAEFRAPDGYYPGMRAEALAALNETIQAQLDRCAEVSALLAE